MEFFASLSTERGPDRLLAELTAGVEDTFGGLRPDLGFLFFTPHHVPELARIREEVVRRTGVRTLLGCTGGAIIGGGREVEDAPSATLWLASLPGVRIRPFSVRAEQTPDGFCFPSDPEDLCVSCGVKSAVLLLGEPYSMPVDAFLRRFNEDCPGVPVVGGMASGGRGPGGNFLLINERMRRDGAAGVMLSGPLRFRTIVSQGCRPIGRHHVVTQCDRNAVLELGGKPALRCVQEMFRELTREDRELFQSAPHVGVVMNEHQRAFGPGDFLIRNVMGVDPDSGAIFLGDYVRRGQTIQFHVRDGRAATDDLCALLDREKNDGWHGRGPRAALMFTCNGRGSRFFGRPDHDIGRLRDHLGAIPVSGFFAQGEVGPVGDRNHLHGFTTCVALFGDP